MPGHRNADARPVVGSADNIIVEVLRVVQLILLPWGNSDTSQAAGGEGYRTLLAPVIDGHIGPVVLVSIGANKDPGITGFGARNAVPRTAHATQTARGVDVVA